MSSNPSVGTLVFILTIIGGIASIYTIIKFIEWLNEKIKIWRINNKQLPRLNDKTKKFLKEEFSIEYDKKFKSTKGNNNLSTDSMILIPINLENTKIDDCSVDIVEVVITQVKQTITSVLTENNYDATAVKEIADLATEEFLEEKIYQTEIRNETTQREIRAKFSTRPQTPITDSLKKNYKDIKKLIKDKTPHAQFNSEFKKKTGKITESLNFQEILKEKENTEIIKEEKRQGDRFIFASKSLRVMENLKEQRLKGRNDFNEYYKNSKITMRGEQIFALILNNWGGYITAFYAISKIPVSTLSRYIASMEDIGLIIKIPIRHKGYFRKEVYPLFAEKDLINYYDEFVSEQMAFTGMVKKNISENIYYLEHYPNLKIPIEEIYLNKKIIVVGHLSKESNEIKLIDIHIQEKN
jgi:hypothetical protein